MSNFMAFSPSHAFHAGPNGSPNIVRSQVGIGRLTRRHCAACGHTSLPAEVSPSSLQSRSCSPKFFVHSSTHHVLPIPQHRKCHHENFPIVDFQRLENSSLSISTTLQPRLSGLFADSSATPSQLGLASNSENKRKFGSVSPCGTDGWLFVARHARGLWFCFPPLHADGWAFRHNMSPAYRRGSALAGTRGEGKYD